MAEHFLTVGEAAAALGIPIHTLKQWTRWDYLPNRRTPGGHRRYLLTELLDARKRADEKMRLGTK